MRRQPSERGMSLVEVMIAVVLLVVAAMGVFQTTRFGLKLNQDARRQTRAITIAQDLLNQIQTWPYDDPRLDNTNTANDADYGDFSGKYETSATVDADHAEADLTAGGADWNGIPLTAISPLGYERFWNVAEPDDFNGNGVPDARRIAVIVRWPQGAGYGKTVLYAVKVNPSPDERL